MKARIRLDARCFVRFFTISAILHENRGGNYANGLAICVKIMLLF